MSGLPSIANKAANEPSQNQETSAGTVTAAIESISVTFTAIKESPRNSFQDEATRPDLRRITRTRLKTLKAIRRGLIASDKRLSDGSELRTNSDAIYYWLDQAAQQLGIG